MGWKWGCQLFSCPCSLYVMHCPEEICSTCLFKTSIPAVPFWNFKHLLSTRSLRLLRAAARSTSSAACLHHACKRQYPRFTVDYRLLIVISVVLYSDCFKSTKNCRDSAFSNSGLEVGLPAFQLPMFAKDALKEICSTCLSTESMPFGKSKNLSLHSLPEA